MFFGTKLRLYEAQIAGYIFYVMFSEISEDVTYWVTESSNSSIIILSSLIEKLNTVSTSFQLIWNLQSSLSIFPTILAWLNSAKLKFVTTDESDSGYHPISSSQTVHICVVVVNKLRMKWIKWKEIEITNLRLPLITVRENLSHSSSIIGFSAAISDWITACKGFYCAVFSPLSPKLKDYHLHNYSWYCVIIIQVKGTANCYLHIKGHIMSHSFL